MRHGFLFSLLSVLLIGVAGGVFVLVNNGEQSEIRKDVFVASVSGGELIENLDGDSQADEKQAQNREVNSQSAPKPAANQTTPTPVPHPIAQSDLPAGEAGADQPLAEALEPVPAPLPIPTPMPTPQPISVASEQPKGKININTASLRELDQISGVGPSIAQNIVDYRTSNGLFYYIEDIKNVSGIADVKFEKMKNEITVGGGVTLNPPPPLPDPAPQPSPPQSVLTPAPSPTSSGHIFYTSSYWSSKLYYCDTDSGWKNLSEKYLESYSTKEELLEIYPEKTIHEPCE